MTHECPRPEFSDSRTLRKSSPPSHRYEGPVAADMRHGDDGKMFYAAGDTYQGAWFEDGREGMGTMWCAWFSTPREREIRGGGGRFVGRRREGGGGGGGGLADEARWVGRARSRSLSLLSLPARRYADDGLYEGEWRADARDGHGVMKWGPEHSGDAPEEPALVEYDGAWRAGARDGAGVCRYADGSHWVGGWAAGGATARACGSAPTGRSRACGRRASSSRVPGARERRSRRHVQGAARGAPPQRAGHGTCSWPDGSDYDGEWRGGKRNGHGVFKDATTREKCGRQERGPETGSGRG